MNPVNFNRKVFIVAGLIALFSVHNLNAQWTQVPPNVFLANPAYNVGIGISTPLRSLHINKSANFTEAAIRFSTTDTYMASHRNHWEIVTVPQSSYSSNVMEFRFGGNGTSENPTMNKIAALNTQGDFIAAGFYDLNNTSYYLNPAATGVSLKVAGKILSKEIEVVELNTDFLKSGKISTSNLLVEVNNVADYVFAPGYQLMNLYEVENYINLYKHLPAIPSALEMENNGMNVAEMNNLLLQKVEELTLYIIAMEKRIAGLEALAK